MKEEIIKLFNSQDYEALAEIVSSADPLILSQELAAIEREELAQIMPKLPEKISAEVFVLFSPTLQKYLAENISNIEFKDISEEILENDEANIPTDVLNEILLKAETDTRHEKLVKIIDNIEGKNYSNLKTLLAEMEPVDIANIINEIDDEKDLIIFRLLPKDLASEVFIEMDSKNQQMLIHAFSDKELSFIVNDLFADDTADLIEEMPSNIVLKLLRVSSRETRDEVNRLLGFPKDCAGSIMTTELVTLRAKMTCEEALKKIKKQAPDKETIYTCYVTDDQKKLLGIVSLKDVILSEPDEKIGDIMEENYISAHTYTDKEEVSNLLSKYDLLAVPIVDSENRINGIVTVDDAIDVLQEEATEDLSKISGITSMTKPYLQTNVFSIFKSRIPWLMILLISATFTGLIINTYETTLNVISPLLFACIPMLMDSGGNAGSQASVTIIRSLALEEVSPKDILKILWKEIRVAILLALILSIACFAKLQLIDKLLFGYDYTLKISAVVSVALFITICIAKIVGSCLPLLAKKCRLDPAVVASPFITTIVDAISLIIYCAIAVAILG